MPFYDLTCANQHEQHNLYLKVGDRPPCPACGEPTETLWTTRANAVIGDDIPGGYTIEHGVCHANGAPRTFYSKAEILRAAREKGLEQAVRHVTDPRSGSDKNRYTTSWAGSADLTDYDDPEVRRQRQLAMARHAGMTLDEYLALTSKRVAVSGRDAQFEADLAVAARLVGAR
jgi:hypothetical protein